MGRMTHDTRDNASLGDRFRSVGFNWKSIAENVAYGQKDAFQVMESWLNSSGTSKQPFNRPNALTMLS